MGSKACYVALVRPMTHRFADKVGPFCTGTECDHGLHILRELGFDLQWRVEGWLNHPGQPLPPKGGATYLSATTISHALEEAVEEFDGSNHETDVFIPKGVALTNHCMSWLNCSLSSSTAFQPALVSGSNSVMADAISVVVFPRSFWNSTPSWLMMKVTTPELPYSAG
jgi:hypothetical protein